MRARAVIGANFGDEGKGLFTDYLCSQGAGVVIRYNGGAQAGHTVVLPDGTRHVFHHVGAGALRGVPTYLSQYFIINPILFLKEIEELDKIGINPMVYAHPECLVTTFADMIINQRKEDQRGAKRHGSVGVGVNETYERSGVGNLSLTMADLWNGRNIEDMLYELCTKYAEFRTGSPIINAESMIEKFIKACEMTASMINPAGIASIKHLDPVFEGAQGLLLSQDNKENFPHVTRSFTGIKNVLILCNQASIEDIDAYYISRTYLTKHGAGFLKGEDANLKFEDKTNLDHPYQGKLRFAPLDVDALLKRCLADFGANYKLVLTHCDQHPPMIANDFSVWGETAEDVCKSGDLSQSLIN